MDKVVKIYLNTLRCPICKGQIDIFVKKGYRYDYACSYNDEHYKIGIAEEPAPHINIENVVVYEGKSQYEIIQNRFSSTSASTIINIRRVNAEFRIIDDPKPKQFVYNKDLFDFQKTDKDKILNRVKTILVFQ